MPLSGRTYVKVDTASRSLARFSVIQYNILADRAIPKNGTGVDICGAYTYCPTSHRYMDSRHPRIIAELLELDADVVCLQEVEARHYYDLLKPALAMHGYRAVAHQRWYDHIGLAIFFRIATFDLIDERSLLLHTAVADMARSSLSADICDGVEKYLVDMTTLPPFGLQPPGFLMAKLRHRSSDQVVVIGNIHVFWGSFRFHCIQVVQIACALSELQDFAEGDNVPTVFAGDFNAEPLMPAYEYLESGGRLSEVTVAKLLEESAEKDVNIENLNLLEIISKHMPRHSALTSSYKAVLGVEPDATNVDDSDVPGRGKPFCGCLDYIWYDRRHLAAVGALATPTLETMAKHYALPSIVYPSDHLSLKAEFAFAH